MLNGFFPFSKKKKTPPVSNGKYNDGWYIYIYIYTNQNFLLCVSGFEGSFKYIKICKIQCH